MGCCSSAWLGSFIEVLCLSLVLVCAGCGSTKASPFNPKPTLVLSSSQPLKGVLGLCVLTGKGVIRVMGRWEVVGIPIDPKDQDKQHSACPYTELCLSRLPFGYAMLRARSKDVDGNLPRYD
ncbi:hypothetical protein Tco_1002568 [Tanacetum coccineum]|uniref:Secreted protein n=1 Tax=Tanacetum coccineum TaxID=301880 RepID=A0ABQ5F6V4_9ASTR